VNHRPAMNGGCPLTFIAAAGAVALSCAASPSCPPISDPRRTPEPPPEQTIDVQESKQPVCEIVPENQMCRDLAARPVPHPRCDVHDPKCGPGSVTGAVADKCYRPDAKRFPDGCWRRLMRDRCTFDGECEAAGNVCLNYRRQKELRVDRVMRDVEGQGTCPRLPDPPPPMWCGCVQGRCTMFTQ
jgi:hypothetical protein